MADEINLFEDDGKTIVIKGINISSREEYTDTKLDDLVSDDLQERVVEAISGEYVSKALLEEESSVRYPNYMIDLRGLKMNKELLPSIRSMLSEDAEASLYILDTKQRLIFLGNCEHSVFHNVICEALKNIFGEECKIYKDYNPMNQNQCMSLGDVSSMRLNI